MTMKKVMTIFMLLAVLTACTENDRTRNWGGKSRIEIPKGNRLIEVTWKEDNLWMLTCPMDSDYTPKTYQFAEKSSWQLYEGEITIVESK